ncbi:heme-degrading domain-containing protein [Adhaeribacter aquaticus]|uniref:heme-degrading domain-containing protein n=1 Tax=Adhaeribacter aquaticus TaxID=299567 RepID=UPI00040532E7|nr:heme-degrading domain-containing protein [Adhaeribacter aquaticus]
MGDIEKIALQEQRLQFDSFNATTAWELGNRLKTAIEKMNAKAAIDIQMNGQPLFFYAMPGTTPDNVEWVRRKRNVVNRLYRSSYAIGLQLQKQNTTLTDKLGVELKDYATHGGCFPLILKNSGCVGTITVSGLPQRDDHEVIVAVLADMLDQPLTELALGTPSK